MIAQSSQIQSSGAALPAIYKSVALRSSGPPEDTNANGSDAHILCPFDRIIVKPLVFALAKQILL